MRADPSGVRSDTSRVMWLKRASDSPGCASKPLRRPPTRPVQRSGRPRSPARSGLPVRLASEGDPGRAPLAIDGAVRVLLAGPEQVRVRRVDARRRVIAPPDPEGARRFDPVIGRSGYGEDWGPHRTRRVARRVHHDVDGRELLRRRPRAAEADVAVTVHGERGVEVIAGRVVDQALLEQRPRRSPAPRTRECPGGSRGCVWPHCSRTRCPRARRRSRCAGPRPPSASSRRGLDRPALLQGAARTRVGRAQGDGLNVRDARPFTRPCVSCTCTACRRRCRTPCSGAPPGRRGPCRDPGPWPGTIRSPGRGTPGGETSPAHSQR